MTTKRWWTTLKRYNRVVCHCFVSLSVRVSTGRVSLFLVYNREPLKLVYSTFSFRNSVFPSFDQTLICLSLCLPIRPQTSGSGLRARPSFSCCRLTVCTLSKPPHLPHICTRLYQALDWFPEQTEQKQKNAADGVKTSGLFLTQSHPDSFLFGSCMWTWSFDISLESPRPRSPGRVVLCVRVCRLCLLSSFPLGLTERAAADW